MPCRHSDQCRCRQPLRPRPISTSPRTATTPGPVRCQHAQPMQRMVLLPRSNGPVRRFEDKSPPRNATSRCSFAGERVSVWPDPRLHNRTQHPLQPAQRPDPLFSQPARRPTWRVPTAARHSNRPQPLLRHRRRRLGEAASGLPARLGQREAQRRGRPDVHGCRRG